LTLGIEPLDDSRKRGSRFSICRLVRLREEVVALGSKSLVAGGLSDMVIRSCNYKRKKLLGCEPRVYGNALSK